MTNRPPTLSDMQHSLTEASLASVEFSAMEPADVEYVLQHYGIKGMRWGFRRTDAQLGRTRIKNQEGEEVGGIRAKSKAAAEKLRNMRTGEVMVIDTDDRGPKVLVKQKDGSFKEATISADAQNVLRTVNKDPSEMSTREMNDAVKRAQAIEAYNRLFNPLDDPNAVMKARVEAMELQMKLAAANARMNPSRSQRVGVFVKNLEPVFDAFNKTDKALGGELTKNLTKKLKKAFDDVQEAAKEPAKTSSEKNKKKNPKPSDDVFYDITDVGRSDDFYPNAGYDYGNPFIPAIERRR